MVQSKPRPKTDLGLSLGSVDELNESNDAAPTGLGRAKLDRAAPSARGAGHITTRMHGGAAAAGDAYLEKVNDMIELADLTDRSILKVLQKRFAREIVYTYISDIVISVNPFKKVTNESDTGADKYPRYFAMKERSQLPPHVFALASQAFTELKRDRRNQSVLISGESGAGKTETTKIILSFLTASAEGGSTAGAADFMKASPVLEAIGNAKTVRNDNSSRFGKFLDVQFSPQMSVIGACTTAYLLEKPRVCTHLGGERNFHVLYMLLKLSDAERGLPDGISLDKSWKQFAILAQKGTRGELDTWDDVGEMRNSHEALLVIGFSEEDRRSLYRIFSMVLLLGNARFDEKREVVAESKQAFDSAAKLAGIDPKKLKEALTIRSVKQVGRKEEIRSPCDPKVAISSLMMHVYSLAFDWTIDKNNEKFAKPSAEKPPSIGILDIFGFENFSGQGGVNSHAQLCINFANESLHYLFSQQVISIEQAIYRNEGINVKDAIDIQDNSDILKLICPESEQRALLGGEAERKMMPKRNIRRQGSNEQWEMDGQDAKVEHPGRASAGDHGAGTTRGGKEETKRRQMASGKNAKVVIGGHQLPSVFSIFDDACAQLKGVAVLEQHDEKAHQELYNRLQRTGFKWTPKKFSIEHYAGIVHYDPTGFVEKNKDELSLDIRKVLAECGFELLKKLAEKDDAKKAEDAKEKKGKAGAFRKKTVFKAFGESLNALLSQLVERKSNWVRCLKPNQDLRPGVFNEVFMESQLAYSGTLQVAKVRKSGYSDRKELDYIWKRYSVCLEDPALLGDAGRESRLKWQKPEAEGGLPLAERVCKLMHLVGAQDGAYEAGHTLLFMRDGVLNLLNDSHRIALRKAKTRAIGNVMLWLIRNRRKLLVAALTTCLADGYTPPQWPGDKCVRLPSGAVLLRLVERSRQSDIHGQRRLFSTTDAELSDLLKQAEEKLGVAPSAALSSDATGDVGEGEAAWRASIFGDLPCPEHAHNIVSRHRTELQKEVAAAKQLAANAPHGAVVAGAAAVAAPRGELSAVEKELAEQMSQLRAELPGAAEEDGEQLKARKLTARAEGTIAQLARDEAERAAEKADGQLRATLAALNVAKGAMKGKFESQLTELRDAQQALMDAREQIASAAAAEQAAAQLRLLLEVQQQMDRLAAEVQRLKSGGSSAATVTIKKNKEVVDKLAESGMRQFQKIEAAKKLKEEEEEKLEAAVAGGGDAAAAAAAKLKRQQTLRVKKQQEEEEHEAKLPAELKDFDPLSHMPNVREAFEPLNGPKGGYKASLDYKLFDAIKQATGRGNSVMGDKDVQKVMEDSKIKLSVAEAVVQKEIRKRAAEDGIVRTCDKVISAGAEFFVAVYEAAWNTVEMSEIDQLQVFQTKIKTLIGLATNEVKQEIEGDTVEQQIVSLFSCACMASGQFLELVEGVQKKRNTPPNVLSSIGQALGSFLPALSLPKQKQVQLKCSIRDEKLKRTSRVLEKVLLNRNDDEPAYTKKVCDLVRAMLQCPSMDTLNDVVDDFCELAASKKIVIVRVKDRLNNPAAGWRDVNINFYVMSDPQKHVCEVQICHATMVMAREGLHGHGVYNRVRNATELLEWFFRGPVDERSKGIIKLNSEGQSVESLATLGCSAGHLAEALVGSQKRPLIDTLLAELEKKNGPVGLPGLRADGVTAAHLKTAGFSAMELKKGGFALVDLKAARYGPAELRDAGYDEHDIHDLDEDQVRLFEARAEMLENERKLKRRLENELNQAREDLERRKEQEGLRAEELEGLRAEEAKLQEQLEEANKQVEEERAKLAQETADQKTELQKAEGRRQDDTQKLEEAARREAELKRELLAEKAKLARLEAQLAQLEAQPRHEPTQLQPESVAPAGKKKRGIVRRMMDFFSGKSPEVVDKTSTSELVVQAV